MTWTACATTRSRWTSPPSSGRRRSTRSCPAGVRTSPAPGSSPTCRRPRRTTCWRWRRCPGRGCRPSVWVRTARRPSCATTCSTETRGPPARASARRHSGAHRNPGGQVVQHWAVLLDLADELRIGAVRLRSAQVHVDLHSPESRAHLITHPEETAEVDGAGRLPGDGLEAQIELGGPERGGDDLAGSQCLLEVLHRARVGSLTAQRGRLVDG